MIDEGEVSQRFTLIASYHKQVLNVLQVGPQNWKSINICLDTLPQLWNVHSFEKLLPLLYINSPIFQKLQILHFYIQLLHILPLQKFHQGNYHSKGMADEVKRQVPHNGKQRITPCDFGSKESSCEWFRLVHHFLSLLCGWFLCGEFWPLGAVYAEFANAKTMFAACLSSFISP